MAHQVLVHQLRVYLGVQFHVRTGAHNGHVSLEHVDELGQLVQGVLPQEGAEAGPAAVRLRAPGAVLLVVHPHGAELVHGEGLLVGFSAVCTGGKDSDSPCFVQIQGEKGYMRIDGKPNVAPNLTLVITDDTKDELVRDAAGAMVRPTIKEEFIPDPVHHRMTREFKDFARMINEKDFDLAEHYSSETLGVMRIVG